MGKYCISNRYVDVEIGLWKCYGVMDLGTSRTPIQCLRHYQQAWNTSLINSSAWTEDEESCLLEAVQLYGDKNWQHVANSIPGRTSLQCENKYRVLCRRDNVVGDWTANDDRKLFLAVVALDRSQNTSKRERAAVVDDDDDSDAGDNGADNNATIATMPSSSEAQSQTVLCDSTEWSPLLASSRKRQFSRPWTAIKKLVPGKYVVVIR